MTSKVPLSCIDLVIYTLPKINFDVLCLWLNLTEFSFRVFVVIVRVLCLRSTWKKSDLYLGPFTTLYFPRRGGRGGSRCVNKRGRERRQENM